MTSEPKWISKKSTLAIHEALLAEHGGAPGLVAEHLIDSALDSPKNHFAYGDVLDLFELATAYARALTKDHPFVDGNKRVALTVSLTFLERNGVIVTASEAEAVEMVLGLSLAGRGRTGLRRMASQQLAEGPAERRAPRRRRAFAS